jgi:cytochrome b subunit of formate dehydrogenase
VSVLDRTAPEPLSNRPGVAALLVGRWLPALLLLVAVAGAGVVLPSIGRDQSAGNYYRGQLGGSSIYSLDTTFARFVPFIIAGAIALALLQRQRRRRALAAGAMVQRHSATEAITHWLNAAGIGLGLLTAAWLLRWLHDPLSLSTTYLLHFIGAGMVLAAVAHHLTYQIVGGGAGLIPRRWADVKDCFAELVGYTGVYRGLRGAFGVQLPLNVRWRVQQVLRRFEIAPERSGKFLATERVLSYPIWAVLVGIIVVTGLVKSLNYLFPIPGGLRQLATFLHDGAAIFIFIFLLIHVGALVLVPRNWPLLKSMVTTRISRKYVDENLPVWGEELDGKPAR